MKDLIYIQQSDSSETMFINLQIALVYMRKTKHLKIVCFHPNQAGYQLKVNGLWEAGTVVTEEDFILKAYR